jgi:ornithine carbamoyltransferase
MRHFLADDDLTGAEQAEILDLADRMAADPFRHRPFAGPHSVAVIFDKHSTRTRVSFATGIAELGGYPLIIDTQTSQLGRGETIADTARVLGRQVSAIVWRTGAQHRIVEMAAHAGVPVINALTDSYHPCQLLADLQTVRQRKRRLSGLTLCYLGDGSNNMASSYLLGGALAGLQVRIGAPASAGPDPEILSRAEQLAATSGGSVLVTDDPHAAADGADVVATDTWTSMGQQRDDTAARAQFGDYAVTPELMTAADADAIVLHCLPAHRGHEISAAVLDGPQSVVWDEAENRKHAQKALLCWLHHHGSVPAAGSVPEAGNGTVMP